MIPETVANLLGLWLTIYGNPRAFFQLRHRAKVLSSFIVHHRKITAQPIASIVFFIISLIETKLSGNACRINPHLLGYLTDQSLDIVIERIYYINEISESIAKYYRKIPNFEFENIRPQIIGKFK